MGGDALNRRRFLEFLAASPLLANSEALAQELQRLPDPSVWGPRTFDKTTHDADAGEYWGVMEKTESAPFAVIKDPVYYNPEPAKH